jgi:hypothetical protein
MKTNRKGADVWEIVRDEGWDDEEPAKQERNKEALVSWVETAHTAKNSGKAKLRAEKSPLC